MRGTKPDIRVVIGTTQGPVTVTALYPEIDELGMSVATISGTTRQAGISSTYAAFAADRQGPLARFSEQCWRLELDQNIDVGQSWQLGATLAHALQHHGRLCGSATEPTVLVWTSGAVGRESLEVRSVDHLDDKLALSLPLLNAARHSGQRVIIAYSRNDEGQLSTASAERLSSLGCELCPALNIGELFGKLSIPKRTLRLPLGQSIRRVGAAVIAALVMLGIAIQYDLASELFPPKPVHRFQDCSTCPEMIVLPRGTYRIGTGNHVGLADHATTPIERRRLAKSVAIAATEVTVAQYEQFAAATGHQTSLECFWPITNGVYGWHLRAGSYADPGYDVAPDHPVTCVNGEDALAFAEWMTLRTKRRYRLPTELEWEIAARAGSGDPQVIAVDNDGICKQARFAHADTQLGQLRNVKLACNAARHLGPVPVGTLLPNAWGFHDMGGNAWELAVTCTGSKHPQRLKCDDVDLAGVASQKRICTSFSLGGGFNSVPRQLHPGHRDAFQLSFCRRSIANGFRLAAEVE